MKKIITILLILVIITAFAMPQEKQATEVAPTDTSYYAMEKADLFSAYNTLIDQIAVTNERLEHIVWAINYLNALEKVRLEKAQKDTTKKETE